MIKLTPLLENDHKDRWPRLPRPGGWLRWRRAGCSSSSWPGSLLVCLRWMDRNWGQHWTSGTPGRWGSRCQYQHHYHWWILNSFLFLNTLPLLLCQTHQGWEMAAGKCLLTQSEKWSCQPKHLSIINLSSKIWFTWLYPTRRWFARLRIISRPAASLPCMFPTSLTMGFSSLLSSLTWALILRPISGWPRTELPITKGFAMLEYSWLSSII